MQCTRHPKVETGLSCGRCGTPICPACSIPGPVGMRCSECSSLKSSALYQIHPARFALGIVTGLVAGAIAGSLLQYGLGFFFFYILVFIGPVVGRFVGDVIVLAVGRKRGLSLEIMTGVTLVIGAGVMMYFFGDWSDWAADPVEGIVYVVAVSLMAGAAILRIRHE